MIAGARQKTGRRAGMGRWLAGAVALVAVIGVAGACDGGDDPGPGETTAVVTATATGDAAEALRERNIAEAKATVEAYAAAENANANNGFRNWESELSPLLTGEALESLRGDYGGIEDEGIYTVGGGKIEELLVVEYSPDPDAEGHEQVLLRACIDTSEVKVYGPGGLEPQDPEGILRFLTNFRLDHQGVGKPWLISMYEWTDEAC